MLAAALSVTDVIVVGAGVIGCAVSRALARAGASVCVLERDDVGAHASSAAAGMLAPSVESRGEGPLFELGVRALGGFEALASELKDETGIDVALARSGALLPRRAGQVETLPALARALESQHAQLLECAELRVRWPRLSLSFEGALWLPGEGNVSAPLLTRAFAQAARHAGARIEPGNEVLDLLRDGDRVLGVRTAAGLRHASHVVWATGAWAAAAQRMLGVTIPVEPVRGEMIALDVRAMAPHATLRHIVWDESVYLVPGAGEVRAGATSERVGFDETPTQAGVERLRAAAVAAVPDLTQAPLRRAWAGLRPATPDERPLIGSAPGWRQLTLACGHFRHGVLFSGLTGDVVTRWILEGRSDPLLRWGDPARFAAPHSTLTSEDSHA